MRSLPLRVETLPLSDLAPYPHAVTWELVWREGTSGRPGRWTKVPKNPRTGGNAMSNNPETWGTVAAVLARFDHVGFMVWTSDPFTFLDLDNAVHRPTNEIKPWAQRIVDRLPGAYWERSTSGSGLKGLIRARPPRNRIIRVGDGQVEIFYSHKFTALTGHRLADSPAAIGEGQAGLDALYRELCGPDPEPAVPCCSSGPALLRDDEVIARARGARNGAKFARLFDRGDTVEYDDDHSRADQALVSLLAFWTQDPDQIDRLLRRSALCRGKWTDRADYRERTTARALAHGDAYSAPGTPLGLRTRRPSLRMREATNA